MNNLFKRTLFHIKKFLPNQDGVNMIEFALILPLLILLLFGLVDLSRYYQFNQKMDNAAYTLNNLIAQQKDITKQKIDIYENSVRFLLTPFQTTDLEIIVTSVVKPNIKQDPLNIKKPYALWQTQYGNTSRPSKIAATAGDIVNLSGFPLEQGDQIVITEMYLTFFPTFVGTGFYKIFNMPADGTYKVNIARPRYNTFKNNTL